MKKMLLILLCACMLLSMAACTAGPKVTDPTKTDPTQGQTNPPTTATPTTAPTTVPPTTVPPTTVPPTTVPPTTVPPTTAPPATEPPATEPPVTAPPATEPPKENPYTNLVAHFADGVNTSDKYTAWGWDPENKFIEASKSLECNWGTGGYGKVFLVDGVKTEKKELLFTQGVWVSCTIKPGWGEFSGEIYTESVTWKKGDLDEWLIFDLQTTCIVDKVNFSTLYQNGSHGMPADFTIQVSSDKVNWKTVVEMYGYEQDITSEDQSFPFKAEECRYVRLNFTKGSTKIDNNLAYCAALSEVEIWGKVK